MKHLFLEGPRGCGKSTLILRELRDILPLAGGFATVRLLNEEKNICGYRQIPPAKISWSAENFLPMMNVMTAPEETGFYPWKTDEHNRKENRSVFEITLPLLSPEVQPAFFLLDEIGGVELVLPEWMDSLKHLISGDVPCIGVLKSWENSRRMRTFGENAQKNDAAYRELRSFLEGSARADIFYMTEESRDAAQKKILLWRKENVL